MIYVKHEAQVNREPKNMSKSIRLDVKKHCNKAIKDTVKNKKLSRESKSRIITMYTEIKNKFKTKQS